MTLRPASVALEGGVDLVSPAIVKNPAHLIGAENYEPRPEGYRRMNGIERYDGRQRPSRESYWTMAFRDGRTDLAAEGAPESLTGRHVLGEASGAQGVIVAVVSEPGGAAGEIVLRSLQGEFLTGETLRVSVPAAFAAGFSGGFA